MPPREPRERLIVALDVGSLAQADALLDRLQDVAGAYKVGFQLFTAAGPAAVERVRKRGGAVFLDLKFHDIPHTVAGAVREATRLGVFMLNVHASGGTPMLRAAAQAAGQAAREFDLARPRCLAVTLLTSLDAGLLRDELQVPLPVEDHVLHLTRLARAAGLDGSVCSPREVRAVRQALGSDWVIVTPGVRPPDGGADDQRRAATPEEAVRAGADYLVVGRPITGAADPAAAAARILEAMARG